MSRQDIIYFDRRGFVASLTCKTMDNYLKEAEAKANLLRRFEDHPEQVMQENGFRHDFQVAIASYEFNEQFFQKTMTSTLPGIVTSTQTYESMGKSTKTSGGTIKSVCDESTGVSTWLPIFWNDGSLTKTDISEILTHETIHCIRNQGGLIKYLGSEEVMAYHCSTKSSKSIDELAASKKVFMTHGEGDYLRDLREYRAGLAGFLFSICTVLASAEYLAIRAVTLEDGPLLGNLFAAPLVTLIFPALDYHLTLYKESREGKRVAELIKRCDSEGLNPFYVYLRSNPREFSSRKPIRDQIAKSKNPRFQVMATRLELK
jgi:hypothetical protein